MATEPVAVRPFDFAGSTTTTPLRNGTRLGYTVFEELVIPPGAVDMDTPLPKVLVAVYPIRFPSMSRARKSCRRGAVLVNNAEGRCISTASPGDAIALQERVAPGFSPRGHPPFPVDIVYEDDHLAVCVKPAGIVSHPPPGGAPGGSMRTAIQYALAPPPLGTPGALYRPHICHRLDRPTSGLMLCAKTKPSLVGLQRQFRERSIRKRYEAIVCGWVDNDAGLIDASIDGLAAVTRYRVAGRARSLRIGGGHLTALTLHPKTGRTHQLRRHCAEVLGCAILGDKAYGGVDVGKGLFLAACELEFSHPERLAEPEPEPGHPERSAEPEVEARVKVQYETPRKFAELLRRENERWAKLAKDA